ncbi:hypothetical protein EV356DRAFT_522107 [Viridothelium virens]|uniref:ATP synthase subunit a n=1 Tax=Viridothelium virens TaxID=1048519 RepID=A0A6A6GSQ5_VIRVR|nr:hypothetical protein EV356DRAFT_522107 [Viridothelium virens]
MYGDVDDIYDEDEEIERPGFPEAPDEIYPLDQFEVRDLLSIKAPILGDINISIANISLYLIIATFIALALNIITRQESIYHTVIGMVPYSFASTSHFILTFSLSFTVVLGATILGFQKHGLKFFSLFVPSGCPLGLLPVLVLIEFISYLARNVSLGLRLAANMVSLPILSFITLFCGLELAISFIQAYVFVVLSASYIRDCLELH